MTAPAGAFARPRWHDRVPALFVIGGAAAAIQLWRTPGGSPDRLYAEDGPEFVGSWLHHPTVWTVWHPYAGYQHFLPRAISGLVVLVLPATAWGWGVTVGACALVGAISALTYRGARELVADPWSRLALAAIPPLVPIAGVEVAANLANLHWYMLWAALWLVVLVPRSPRTGVAVAIASAAVAATEIQVLALAPLMLWVVLRGDRSRSWAVAGWALGGTGQVLSWVLDPRPRPAGRPSVHAAVDGYAYTAGLSDVWPAGHVTAGVWVRLGWLVPFACLSVLLVLAAGAITVGRSNSRAVVVAAVGASAASWFVTYFENNAPGFDFARIPMSDLARNAGWLSRWGTAAAMLLLLPVPLLAARLREGVAGRARCGSALLALVGAVLAGGLVRYGGSVSGPSWSGQVRIAVTQCHAHASRRDVLVRTTPRRWHVQLPCSATR